MVPTSSPPQEPHARVPPHTAQVAKVSRRSTCNPLSEKALEVRASGERNESFALGKRFAVTATARHF